MAKVGEQSCDCEDIEQGRRHSQSDAGDGDSLCFSDVEEHSWHSPCDGGGRASGASFHEIDGSQEPPRKSCFSESSAGGDGENGILEIKVNVDKAERDCRICQLSLEKSAPESGIPIVLGCSCKDDLAAAHRQCAEKWFKIKGNKICEICGSTAINVVGLGESELTEQQNELSTPAAPSVPPSETRRFWQGHRFLNFLLACLVFAFVISWLFHFNVPG